MPSAKHGIKIPSSALTWRFSRNSGPGGQHVNTSDTRVELTCDLTQVRASSQVVSRIKERLGEQITVTAGSQRSQVQNRKLALEKLIQRIEKASKAPKSRFPTKPTRSSVQNRLDDKRRHSILKKERHSVNDD